MGPAPSTRHPTPMEAGGALPEPGGPHPSRRALGMGSSGNGCFLETWGQQREEGAPELIPWELLGTCRGSDPGLSSQFPS